MFGKNYLIWRSFQVHTKEVTSVLGRLLMLLPTTLYLLCTFLLALVPKPLDFLISWLCHPLLTPVSSWADTSEPIGQKRKGKPDSFCFLFQVGHPWSKLRGQRVSSHAIEGSSFPFWKCQSLLISEVLREQSVPAPSRWHMWVPITFLKPPFTSLFDEPKLWSGDKKGLIISELLNRVSNDGDTHPGPDTKSLWGCPKWGQK